MRVKEFIFWELHVAVAVIVIGILLARYWYLLPKRVDPPGAHTTVSAPATNIAPLSGRLSSSPQSVKVIVVHGTQPQTTKQVD